MSKSGIDCSKNTLIQKEETEKPGEIINGVSCKSYYISGGDAKSRQPPNLQFFYPVDKEFIDWKLYANFNDLFYNKVVFKMQAPFYKLMANPVAKFIDHYILHLGFLDGKAGYSISKISAYATYLKYKKIRELYKQQSLAK